MNSVRLQNWLDYPSHALSSFGRPDYAMIAAAATSQLGSASRSGACEFPATTPFTSVFAPPFGAPCGLTYEIVFKIGPCGNCDVRSRADSARGAV